MGTILEKIRSKQKISANKNYQMFEVGVVHQHPLAKHAHDSDEVALAPLSGAQQLCARYFKKEKKDAPHQQTRYINKDSAHI